MASVVAIGEEVDSVVGAGEDSEEVEVDLVAVVVDSAVVGKISAEVDGVAASVAASGKCQLAIFFVLLAHISTVEDAAVVSATRAEDSTTMDPMASEGLRTVLEVLEVLEGLADHQVVVSEVGQVGQVVMVLQVVATAAVAATVVISSAKGPVGLKTVTQNDQDIRHAPFICFMATHFSLGPLQVERTRTSLWFVCKYPCWAFHFLPPSFFQPSHCVFAVTHFSREGLSCMYRSSARQV